MTSTTTQVLKAIGWGLLSAVSLPIGAVIALNYPVGIKWRSASMAYGAGALLFALALELFGEELCKVQTGEQKSVIPVLSMGLCALVGAIFFLFVNRLLEDKGGFFRNFALKRSYFQTLYMRLQTKLMAKLRNISVLHHLYDEELMAIFPYFRKVSFRRGETIFNEIDQHTPIYFILTGTVEMEVISEEDNDRKVLTFGESDIIGEWGIVTKKNFIAKATTKSRVKALKLSRENLNILMKRFKTLEIGFQHSESHAKLTTTNRAQSITVTGSQIAIPKLNLPAHTEPVSADYNESPLSTPRSARSDISDSNDLITPRSERGPDIGLLTENPENNLPVGEKDIRSMDKKDDKKHESTPAGGVWSIWLGMLIDGVPESLVIGFSSSSPKSISIAFIAGVFLANLPEAMCSSIAMHLHGLSKLKILGLWSTIVIITGLGAGIGASFSALQEYPNFDIFVGAIQGLAAGAMLVVIAQTMFPEAFHLGGGDITGISAVLGFVSALLVRIADIE